MFPIMIKEYQSQIKRYLEPVVDSREELAALFLPQKFLQVYSSMNIADCKAQVEKEKGLEKYRWSEIMRLLLPIEHGLTNLIFGT